ncbi:HET-domain-containing protein [Lentithecium fluviatile CBS 122367]|uniref:HET-domain-containing protein n=1 Tax=Lentithecium fluviatile CBS 122367 TaxID=1168545 RepID=A0A6G1JIZ9_9PLEO|nr:HET-domain-containing protein [Lentithecium fluviatile CBS 122367]
MLCNICVCMLRGGRSELWTGSLDRTYQHHSTIATLRGSKEAGCTICIGLSNILQHKVDLLNDLPIAIRASLHRVMNKWQDDSIYLLEFDLNKKYMRTYLLKGIDASDRCPRVLSSLHTSSEETLEVACNWISKCRCADFWDEPGPKWYPKRLLDLSQLRKLSGLRHLDHSKPLSAYPDLERCKVPLVESSELWKNDIEDYCYVTLSHCWGKPKSTQGQLKLTAKTEERFIKNGIQLGELSKSFREAVLFASRLERVGYIWIDSLCIKQAIKDPNVSVEDAQGDFLEQSRVMHKVYLLSYLNISATAAVDGDRGLFFSRRPELLWEDEINVYYPVTDSPSALGNRKVSEQLKRCALIDPKFWDELVEEAPVNRRGWVLQERLMAPRVLHFCHNQIAWECSEFHDAEGHPRRYLDWHLKLPDVVHEGGLKRVMNADVFDSRETRLDGYPDPDRDMEGLDHYERWKRTVEVYSRTSLSFSSDKLIALAGIARVTSKDVMGNYVAGLWRTHLESQLLWQVNEVYNDGIFENPSRRDGQGVPSFSWASISSPHGITYGDVTDYAKDRAEELFFKVVDHNVVLIDLQNPFGPIKEGILTIEAQYLRPIKLRKLQPSKRVPYSWLLEDDKRARRLEEYNLTLDAPESDIDVFSSNAKLFCMPAAFGERTVRKSARSLFCLLLLLEEPTLAKTEENSEMRAFRRIGITKLSGERSQRALREIEANELIYLV